MARKHPNTIYIPMFQCMNVFQKLLTAAINIVIPSHSSHINIKNIRGDFNSFACIFLLMIWLVVVVAAFLLLIEISDQMDGC